MENRSCWHICSVRENASHIRALRQSLLKTFQIIWFLNFVILEIFLWIATGKLTVAHFLILTSCDSGRQLFHITAKFIWMESIKDLGEILGIGNIGIRDNFLIWRDSSNCKNYSRNQENYRKRSSLKYHLQALQSSSWQNCFSKNKVIILSQR